MAPSHYQTGSSQAVYSATINGPVFTRPNQQQQLQQQQQHSGYSCIQTNISHASQSSWSQKHQQQLPQPYFRPSNSIPTNFDAQNVNQMQQQSFANGAYQAPNQFVKSTGFSNVNTAQTSNQNNPKKTIGPNDIFSPTSNQNSNIVRYPPSSSMIAQNPRLNNPQNFGSINRPGIMMAPSGSMLVPSGGGVVGQFSAQSSSSSSYYSSSVVLSQLLGPNQTHLNTNNNNNSMYDYSLSNKQSQAMIRSVPPNPSMFSDNPHFVDTNYQNNTNNI